MVAPTFRKVVACVLAFGWPASVYALDPDAAMVHTKGAAWLNGEHIPLSTAIFVGDLLQTRYDSAASINAPGSSIAVAGDSLIEFQGTSLKVEHGGIAVSTSRGIATTAGEVRIQPSSNVWTEFNVTDTDGTVKIAALKGDITITDDGKTAILAQGQETTRQEIAQEEKSGSSEKSDKKRKKPASSAAPAAVGGLLNSKAAIGIGAGIIGGVSIWALVGRNTDDAVSPAIP